MVAFGQGNIIAGEVAFAPASGQRAHERRSAPRHRGIKHLATMILLSQLFASENISAIFRHHVAQLTLLPIGNSENAAPASTYKSRESSGAVWEKLTETMGRKYSCRLFDPHSWDGVLRLENRGFNHNLVWAWRT